MMAAKQSQYDTLFTVVAHDVNKYIQSFSEKEKLSSKDIRTWLANVLYIKHLSENKEGEVVYKKRCANALRSVAHDLHNTPAVCKSAYIFPIYLT
jgi:DNA topoisomerase-1